MPIIVRRPTSAVTDLPRWWVGGSRVGTWFGDAGHVFIPLGERFFIDAVKAFRDDLDEHGAEELEHRSVAFDVLADVRGDWMLRVAGLALGTALLTAVPAVGVALFAAA